MPDDPKQASPSINLPKGGGAIQGIGETFQPNLFTGTGNFSVPIAASPGRSGFGPQLALRYSSGCGNGPYGVGWELSVPRIARKTEKGLPEYRDTDVFVMSGAEDLVPVLDESGQLLAEPDQAGCIIRRYRPRTEGLFARIERWKRYANPGDMHWRATTRDNVTSIYGKSSAARIVDPDNPARVYAWLLEETFDGKGNHILYEYVQEDPDRSVPGIHERNRRYTQAYIRRILYGNTPDSLATAMEAGPRRTGTHHRDPAATLSRHYVFELLFDYGDLPHAPAPGYPWRQHDTPDIPDRWPVRSDPSSSYRSGFEIRTLRRCKRALMLHHFKEGELTDAALVKSTDFAYSVNPDTQLAFLAEVRVVGYRKDPQDPSRYVARDVPPVSFEYSRFEPGRQRYRSVTAAGEDMPPLSLSDPNTALIDIFGDGLADVVRSTKSGFHHWQNLGDGVIDRRHSLHETPAGVSLDQPNVAISDMGGDGLTDLLVKAPPLSGFYEATPDGGWRPFKLLEAMPSIDLTDPDVRLVDLTGDGLADILVTRDHHFIWFRCSGEQGYHAPQAIERIHDLERFPDVYLGDAAGRVRLADMTGDGLNDIVLVHDGRIDYWPNLGYGRFGKRVTLGNAPRIGHGYDPRRLFLADLDGSGCADIVYVESQRVRFCFNQSGNAFSAERILEGTPRVDDLTAVQFSDILGTGTAALVWSYDYGTTAGGNFKVLDFCGGTKPNLLIEMDNGMGATTRVQYAPSTKFYLEDKKRGRPWLTSLPFPVHVLEKTEVIDHISKTKLVSTYDYHHGYFDGREREFRGFGRVDRFDSEIFELFAGSNLHEGDDLVRNNERAYHVPPVETRTWYHTGIYFDPDRHTDHRDLARQYRSEYYEDDSLAFELGDHDFRGPDGSSGFAGAPHEAFRALRGAQLRVEVYARDGSSKARHPYTVVESRYQVRALQAPGGNTHAVFLASLKESLSYNYERNSDDPRVTQTLALDVDLFGNVVERIEIAYPRRDVTASLPEQSELRAVYSRVDHINVDRRPVANRPAYYYSGVSCQTRRYEITGLGWQAGDMPLTESALPDAVRDRSLPAGGIPDVDPATFEAYEWERPPGAQGIKRRLMEWTRSYYRMDEAPSAIDAVGRLDHRLQLGDVDSMALRYEGYQAVFRDAHLQHVYAGRHLEVDLAGEGGYHPPADHPAAEGRLVADYRWIPTGRQGFDAGKFFLPTSNQDPFGNVATVEFDDYGLSVRRTADALPAPQTNATSARCDYRVLQPCEVIDPNRNRVQVAFDALGLVVGTAVVGVEANGNPVAGDSLAGFQADLAQTLIDAHVSDPLGRDSQAVLGSATTRLIYDLNRFRDHRQPNVVYTLMRETHAADEQGTPSKVQHSFLYCDGFGREFQSKVQAEPGSTGDLDRRWVGTGSKLFNNKGKPTQKFEPFFSSTHLSGIERHGVSHTLFYDPLERVICAIHPNHSYEKIVFDPWQQRTWDANDTVLLDPRSDIDVASYVASFLAEHDRDYRTTHGHAPGTWHEQRANSIDAAARAAARATEPHAGTPSQIHVDGLGRTFLTVLDNGDGEYLRTRLKLDVQGNERALTDPRNIVLYQHYFDMAGRMLRVDSRDAGNKWELPGADGKRIRAWDANGSRFNVEYDALRRATKIWVDRAAPHNDRILAQALVYGERLADGLQPDAAALRNHRGRIYAVFDGAGALFTSEYDFKGNPTETRRMLARAYDGPPDWRAVDMALPLEQIKQAVRPMLESEMFVTTTELDALNRVVRVYAPDHTTTSDLDAVNPKDGSVYEYGFNEANLLTRVDVNLRPGRVAAGTFRPFVRRVDYNARGQRERIVYGNNVTTEYGYDGSTFRLARLSSRRSNGDRLQDLRYTDDPVGNIVEVRDDAVAAIWHDQQQIEPAARYSYDAVYRLAESSGREHKSVGAGQYRAPATFKQSAYLKLPPTSDAHALQMYAEAYTYDASGNITRVTHHRGPTAGGMVLWARTQAYAHDSNRILSSGAGSADPANGDAIATYAHDANGNLLRLPHLKNGGQADGRNLHWDHADQLVRADLDLNGSVAYYVYDAGCLRARKVVIRSGIREEWIYLGNYEIYRKHGPGGATTFERRTLHVVDDRHRIALVEHRTAGDESGEPALRFRYQLGNHLGSSVTEVDETVQAKVISYEEHYPYGGTAFIGGGSAQTVEHAASAKRYRYSGKERDDESSLCYFGLRYLAPWLGRWCSADPAGQIDGSNVFSYAGNNPLSYTDPTGASKDAASKEGDVQIGLNVHRGWEVVQPMYIDPEAGPVYPAHVISIENLQIVEGYLGSEIVVGATLKHYDLTDLLVTDESGRAIGFKPEVDFSKPPPLANEYFSSATYFKSVADFGLFMTEQVLGVLLAEGAALLLARGAQAVYMASSYGKMAHAVKALELEGAVASGTRAAAPQVKVAERAVIDASPGTRTGSLNDVMGGRAAELMGREDAVHFHLRAASHGGGDVPANIVQASGGANAGIMKFENALTASARLGNRVETEIMAHTKMGTDAATHIEYRAWINGQKVLDVRIDPNMPPLTPGHQFWGTRNPAQLVKAAGKN